MEKVYRGHKFWNVDNFEEFLKKNAKRYDPLYFEQYLDDFIFQWEDSASKCYELNSFDTFSGNPEGISFEVVQPFYNEDDVNIPPEIFIFWSVSNE